jgi:hypothetical protein
MRLTALAIVAVVVAGSSARAHHGYANFFMDRTVAIEGEIQKIRWANPHVVLEIRSSDSTIYTAYFHQSASYYESRERSLADNKAAAVDPRNNYYPLNRQSLKVGDHVVVVGSPPRDPASHELVTITEVRRPRDGWFWKRFNEPNDVVTRGRP